MERSKLTHGRDETNTETGEETAGNEHGLSSGGSLEDDTQVEDNHGGEHETIATTEEIGNGSSSEGTEEGTGGEDGDNQGLLRGSDGRGRDGREFGLEVVHGQDTRDGTGVITIEDTTEGHKQADENGGPVTGVSDGMVLRASSERTMRRRERLPAS